MSLLPLRRAREEARLRSGDGSLHGEPYASGHCGTEGGIRREHAVVPMMVTARGRHQGRQPIRTPGA